MTVRFRVEGFIPVFIVIVLFLGGVWGWVENIISLIHQHDFSGLMFARMAGIFIAPLGAVLGYV